MSSKTGSASKIKMESFDDLFGGSSVQETGAEQIINAPLADLYEFKDHPFKVLDDEKMEKTTESIREYGVLVPGIARPRAGGGYELIAGHRRKHGSERAGKTGMPIIVRNYSDDEATIIMVNSNIQREDILPSEKAKAYKMKYEAMKHQGKKSGKNTLDEVGEAAGENAKKVQRYIWLARLCEVVCVKHKTVKIGGDDYPYELVKSKFLKLDSSLLEYVMERMKSTTTKIVNIKAYMVTALYNAPSTINHYYQQEVQHDMYGGGWHEKGII